MYRTSRFISPFILAASLTLPVVSIGCAARVNVYDEWHHDNHRWDDHEEVVYRAYLTENHRDYHPYKQLSRDEQKNYWDWRHSHPDR